MKFHVYCDESRPDLLASKNPPAAFTVIGSLWMSADDRAEFKNAIHRLRDAHRVGGEFKWQKVSPSRAQFYEELLEWFFGVGERLRFRCIAVAHSKVNLVQYHENDQELGFYKFYYQVLHHWIMDFNEYAIFCDAKKNRDPNRLHVLRRCLDASNLSSAVPCVQAIRSDESVLIQLADVLTGIAAARLNNTLRPGGTKERLVQLAEARLGRPIRHTAKAEQKFNVFVINLQGGW
jgi:hypothetical protein